ncbi:MAG: NAD(P)H-hydrate dehydratase [Chloroflexota bacterium]
MKYVSVAQMVAIEREAHATGLTYDQMMENAGRGLAEVILDEYGFLEEEGILGLVGSGNNGGDALVALSYLAEQGWPVRAYIVRSRPQDDPLVARLEANSGQIHTIQGDPDMELLGAWLKECALLLDGVLGTGTRLPLKPELAQVLDFVHQNLGRLPDPPAVIAIDCPSGIDCDSGEAAPECIPAEMTVTMAAIKHGLYKFPACDLLGELRLVDIGLPENGEALQAWRNIRTFVPNSDWVSSKLPERPNHAHKGTFGTALVVAGCTNYTGAAWLAGQAAYRIGAGLVTLGVPDPLHPILAGQFPEATWLPLPSAHGAIAVPAAESVRRNLGRATALLLGPGFGLSEDTAAFLAELFSAGHYAALPALVVDADGLKLLAGLPDWPARLPSPAVLTPHPGEMSVLTGLPTSQIQADRLALALRYSHKWKHVIILKGAFTVIASPDGEAAIIPVATPALARAGTGDVLAGLVAGLRAQGLEAFPAAVAAAWIHAQAGLLAAHQLGSTTSVLASDVLRACIDILADLA